MSILFLKGALRRIKNESAVRNQQFFYALFELSTADNADFIHFIPFFVLFIPACNTNRFNGCLILAQHKKSDWRHTDGYGEVKSRFYKFR